MKEKLGGGIRVVSRVDTVTDHTVTVLQSLEKISLESSRNCRRGW